MRTRSIAAFLLLVWACILAGCAAPPPAEILPDPIVTIRMENGSTIQLELYPNVALNTVSNFVCLIQQGFYDGLTFHRVVPGFVIQSGDPNANSTGGCGYTIRGEFAKNGYENDISHVRGVVSMARGRDYDSAGSQFFIVHADATYLDGDYAAFGKVVDETSMAVVDAIANTPADASDKPLVDWVIESVTVDTKGYQYDVVKIEEE